MRPAYFQLGITFTSPLLSLSVTKNLMFKVKGVHQLMVSRGWCLVSSPHCFIHREPSTSWIGFVLFYTWSNDTTCKMPWTISYEPVLWVYHELWSVSFNRGN